MINFNSALNKRKEKLKVKILPMLRDERKFFHRSLKCETANFSSLSKIVSFVSIRQNTRVFFPRIENRGNNNINKMFSDTLIIANMRLHINKQKNAKQKHKKKTKTITTIDLYTAILQKYYTRACQIFEKKTKKRREIYTTSVPTILVSKKKNNRIKQFRLSP